jgi:hypothetical protein
MHWQKKIKAFNHFEKNRLNHTELANGMLINLKRTCLTLPLTTQLLAMALPGAPNLALLRIATEHFQAPHMSQEAVRRRRSELTERKKSLNKAADPPRDLGCLSWAALWQQPRRLPGSGCGRRPRGVRDPISVTHQMDVERACANREVATALRHSASCGAGGQKRAGMPPSPAAAAQSGHAASAVYRTDSYKDVCVW